MAVRWESARRTLVSLLEEHGELSQPDAEKVADFYIRIRVVKLDAVGGVYRFTHGAFVERDIIHNALRQARAHVTKKT